LAEVWRKNEAREARIPQMPVREGETFQNGVERAYDWLNLSKAQQKERSEVATGIEHLKKLAKDHNLTLQEAQTVVQTEMMKSASEHARLMTCAHRQNSTVSKLVSQIDKVRKHSNLSSAFVLEHAHRGIRST
jgi:hypothetical protein